MKRRPPRPTRTYTLFPYTALCRSLEMIDVDHQRRNRSTLVQATMPFPHQTVVQRPAIGNAGQAVFGSQLGQLAIGHFKLRSAFGNARLESEIGRAHV